MQLKNNQNFIKDIKNLIDSAKQKVIRSVDNQRVLLYWSIGERIFEEEQEGKNRAEYGKQIIKNLSQLNWSQYKLLIRIKDEDKREFYILESLKNSWNGRELERQINSSLFERLLLSSDKKDILEFEDK